MRTATMELASNASTIEEKAIVDRYMEVLKEIKAEFGNNWCFPAAETVLKMARREYRDNLLTKTQFDEIHAKAFRLMQPYIKERYADKPKEELPTAPRSQWGEETGEVFW